MIRQIEIQNFKSVQELKLDLGRFNVLIGENGCGKSNILEAIAFASAASTDRLDHEFMSTRGVRTTDSSLMVSAFNDSAENKPNNSIRLVVSATDNRKNEWEIGQEKNIPFIDWSINRSNSSISDIQHKEASLMFFRQAVLERLIKEGNFPDGVNVDELKMVLHEAISKIFDDSIPEIVSFLVYAPENTSLRTFQSETQILPLGIKGEGLFAHLKALSAPKFSERLKEISDRLDLIDWFAGFDVPEDLAPGERRLRIRDRYLVEQQVFDQRSANEGFLFLLFYFTLFISPDTPAFFAIDNVDASLNPKLCSELIRELVKLAEKYDKQVILTTHNPAILDGLNLHDDEQRLMVVYRNSEGHTKVRRVKAPQPVEGEPPVKLSEAFLRGYIGGLPKNF